MEADLGNLFSVALLALLGTWIIGRFSLGPRVLALVPLILAVLITWAFGTLTTPADIFIQGGASGLLATGFFHTFFQILGSR